MRISHAIFMTIGCALGFTAYRGLAPQLNDAFRTFGQVYCVIMGVVIGTVLTGCTTLALRRRTGDTAAMTQPGHWLLAFAPAAALANAGAVLAYYTSHHVVRPADAGIRPPYWVLFTTAGAPQVSGMIHQAVGWGLGALAALAFFRMSRRWLPWYWRALLLVAATGALSFSAGYVAALVDFWGRPASIFWCSRAAHLYAKVIAVCFLMIVLALARDAWKGRRGDTLHWTGVSAWVVIAAMQLGLYFRIMFIAMPYTQYFRALFIPWWLFDS